MYRNLIEIVSGFSQYETAVYVLGFLSGVLAAATLGVVLGLSVLAVCRALDRG